MNKVKKLFNNDFKNLQKEWNKISPMIERLNFFQQKMKNLSEQLAECASDSELVKTDSYQKLNESFKNFQTEVKKALDTTFIVRNLEKKLLKMRQYFLADLENQRKMNTINQNSNKFEIKRNIFGKMLKIVDMFVLSLKFQTKNPETQKFLIGMKMVYDMLNDFLQEFDIRLLQTKPGQKYDYNLHQALKQINDPKLETNTIVSIEQNGYLIGNQVLRQTKVIINNHNYNQKPPKSKNNIKNMKTKEKKHE